MLWDLNLISAKIFAPIIVILGFVGNLVGLIFISNKKLNQMGPQKIFICMFTIGLYLLGGLHTLTKIYTVYSLEKFCGLPDLDTWWFMKEIKNEPDGMYWDRNVFIIKIETRPVSRHGEDASLSR